MSTPNIRSTPYLVALEPGAGHGRRIPLTQDHLVVGRAATSDLRLDDEHVSRTHAALRQQGGHVWVQDLGSSGGTFVNGQKVTGPHELRPGDVVSFATVQMRFAPDEMSGGETTTMPRLDTRGESGRTSDTAPQVRYDIGRQSAGSISNVGRDQYLSYVQHVTRQRESFLREVAATRTKARWLVWSGFLLSVVGIGLFAAGFYNFSEQGEDFIRSGDLQASGPDASMFFLGLAVGVLGQLLLIVGIVLHVVATSRRRRIHRDLPVPPRWQGQNRGV